MALDPVKIEWNTAELTEFFNNPRGEVGQKLMVKIGEIVLAGAKRRALVRTGRMRDEMYMKLSTDERGVYVDIISPVNYAIYHERKYRPRDRRPHRSLMPAIKDARKVLKAGREL